MLFAKQVGSRAYLGSFIELLSSNPTAATSVAFVDALNPETTRFVSARGRARRENPSLRCCVSKFIRSNDKRQWAAPLFIEQARTS